MLGVLTPGLVSVVTCTHNRPLFVRKAIEIFDAQTWPKKEMILMDDGGPGGVPSVLPPGVQHVRIPSYTWITHKRRMAYELCRGEFIACQDDDDWFSPRRLALQAQHLMDGKADVCGFHVKLMVKAPDARFIKWKRSTIDKWTASHKPGWEQGLPFHDSTAMWRSTLLEGIPETVRQGTELDLLRTMRARGARLSEIPNDGDFIYVRHSRVGWDFNVDDLCESADCPPWVPRNMIAFWANPALANEGVRLA